MNLLVIAEAHEVVPVGGGRCHLRKPGDPLSPARLDQATLNRMCRELGFAIFNCQYQQNPIAPDGSPLRWEWFGTYDEMADRNWYQEVIQSWDIGMSADPEAYFSACTTWGSGRTTGISSMFGVGSWITRI